MIANCNIKKKDQSHITHMFYWESIKIKTPLSYIMYIMDHETISYKTIIQELSVQYNHLTLSYKNQQIHVPILCLQTTCLLCAIPAMENLQMIWIASCLGCALIMGTSTVCVIAWVHFTQITTDSQTVPFTCYLNWVSTGSDMHVVNSGKSSVACEITDCELINN